MTFRSPLPSWLFALVWTAACAWTAGCAGAAQEGDGCGASGPCDHGGLVGGICVSNLFCAYPDPVCESGYRYGAGQAQVSGKCMPERSDGDGATSAITSTSAPDSDGTLSEGAGSTDATGNAATGATTSDLTTSTSSTSSTSSSTGSGSDTSGTTTTTTGSSGSSTTGGCQDLGGSCVTDDGCCSECATCTSGTCTAKAEGDACGAECHACDAAGACNPTPGADCGECRRCNTSGFCNVTVGEMCGAGECERCAVDGTCSAADANGQQCTGPQFDCTQFVWGEQAGNCYAYSGMVFSTCQGGNCQQASVNECTTRGTSIANCDSRCVQDLSACQAGASVTDVTVDTLCVTGDTKTATCNHWCISGQHYHSDRSCNDSGQCRDPGLVDCAPYACANDATPHHGQSFPGECFTTCDDDSQCWNTTCVGGVCQP